jgi:hypothetical protein
MLTDCGVTVTMGTIQADVHDTVRRITTPGCLVSAMAKPMYCSDPDAKASILRQASKLQHVFPIARRWECCKFHAGRRTQQPRLVAQTTKTWELQCRSSKSTVSDQGRFASMRTSKTGHRRHTHCDNNHRAMSHVIKPANVNGLCNGAAVAGVQGRYGKGDIGNQASSPA